MSVREGSLVGGIVNAKLDGWMGGGFRRWLRRGRDEEDGQSVAVMNEKVE